MLEADRSAAARLRVFAALAPLTAGYLLSYLLRNVNGAMAPDIMQDLGFGADTLGQATSVYFLLFAAAQLPTGMLLDRYGPHRVQAGLLLLAVAGAWLCSAATNPASFMAGRAMIGLGTAGALVAALKAASLLVPASKLALTNGVITMFGGVGALAATWPIDIGLRHMDWRALLGLLAIIIAATALATLAAAPRRDPAPLRRPARDAAPGLREIVSHPTFIAFCPLYASITGAVFAMQGVWAGRWMADVNLLSRAEVTTLLACMAGALIVSAPCWGLLTRWLLRRDRLLAAGPLTGVAAIGVELLIMSGLPVPAVMTWSLFALFGGMTVMSFSVLAHVFPVAALGRANAALNVMQIGCAFALQFGYGQIIVHWPGEHGHYPVQAYRMALLLPIALQLLALAWFAGCRCARFRSQQAGAAVG